MGSVTILMVSQCYRHMMLKVEHSEHGLDYFFILIYTSRAGSPLWDTVTSKAESVLCPEAVNYCLRGGGWGGRALVFASVKKNAYLKTCRDGFETCAPSPMVSWQASLQPVSIEVNLRGN